LQASAMAERPLRVESDADICTLIFTLLHIPA